MNRVKRLRWLNKLIFVLKSEKYKLKVKYLERKKAGMKWIEIKIALILAVLFQVESGLTGEVPKCPEGF